MFILCHPFTKSLIVFQVQHPILIPLNMFTQINENTILFIYGQCDFDMPSLYVIILTPLCVFFQLRIISFH